MSLTGSYLVTTKNLQAFLNAIQTAQAPERFTNKFLQDLEFKSTNDRLFIGLLKGLGFIDDSGIPQERYYQFLDQTEAPRVLAEAIKEAYDDLFRINKDAYKLSDEDVKNKLKTLTRGEKSEKVVTLMAKTFRALCEAADWTPPLKGAKDESTSIPSSMPKQPSELEKLPLASPKVPVNGLHYNIEIHLPATRDAGVYDAIFRSLREHLL
jgi:hypothetical protein